MSRDIVFIASLGHSGSTLVDLMLGGHPRFVGLGEVAPIVRSWRPNAICSCGRGADACEFWGPVGARLRREPGAGEERRAAIVRETFATVFGPEVTPVDSSKSLDWLDVVRRAGGEPRVVFLLKDVRNFTVSEVEAAARKRAQGKRRRQMSFFGAFTYWYRHNRALELGLQQRGLPVFRVGYEEICLATEPAVRGLCAFLGVEFEPGMLDLRRSRSHVLAGNRMRSQPEKREIVYDSRWFTRSGWLLPALLCPWVMRFNRDRVYGNGADVPWRT